VCPDDEVSLVHPGSAVGQLVGRYRILQALGRGQAGTVYRANQVDLDRVVAVKIITGPSEEQARRFLQEARVIAGLHHAHVVHLFEVGRTPVGDLFMAMELLDGIALDRVLAAEAPLAQRRAVQVAAQVADGLAAAHAQGIVHRDLKPANLFLVHAGTTPVVKILDFGLAKLTDSRESGAARAVDFQADEDDSSITAAGALVGSPWYMSPEQCRDAEVDPRSDLYALGAVLYEMLTGAPPFVAPTIVRILQMHLNDRAEPPLARNALLHPELSALVLQMLEKDPARRPPGAEAVGLALRRLERALAETDDLTYPDPAVGAATVVGRAEAPARGAGAAPGSAADDAAGSARAGHGAAADDGRRVTRRLRGPTKNVGLPRDGSAGTRPGAARAGASPGRPTHARADTDADLDPEEELSLSDIAELDSGADDDLGPADEPPGQHTVVDVPSGFPGAARGGRAARAAPAPVPEPDDWETAAMPETPTDATLLEPMPPLAPPPAADAGDTTRPVPVPRSRARTPPVALDDADIELIDLDAAIAARRKKDGA